MSGRPTVMMQRIRTEPRWLARFTLGILAGANTAWAISMVLLNDVLYRYAWPVWFGFAAIACATAALRLTQHTAAVAGAATLTAAIGRCVAVITSWASSRLTAEPYPRITIEIASWIVVATLVGLLFFRGLLRVAAKKS